MTSRPYIVGFALSIGFTLLAPLLLWLHESFHHNLFTHQELRIAFVVLALLQLVVQLVYFLHVGRHSSRSKLVVLAFTLFVVGVLVGGTFWIMANLAHMMHMPEAPDVFMEENISPHAL